METDSDQLPKANSADVEPAAPSEPQDAAHPLPDTSPSLFFPGRIVSVQSRTWPGINKPGGVGRITQIYQRSQDSEVTHVDVKYHINGGREKKVDVCYVQLAPDYENVGDRTLRDHKSMAPRCPDCISFLTDCTCDRTGEQRSRVNVDAPAVAETTEEKDDTEVIDSEEEDNLALDIVRRYKALMRKKHRSKRRRRSNAGKKAQEETTSSLAPQTQKDEFDEDIPLAALEKDVKAKKEQERNVKKKRRRIAHTSVLASLPEGSAVALPSERNAVPATATASTDRSKAFNHNASSDKEVDAGIANVSKQNNDLVIEEEIVGNARAREADTETDDEVEILFTPREDFDFDANSSPSNNVKNNKGGQHDNAALEEKLLTPTPLDEDQEASCDEELLTPRPLDEDVEFGGTNEITFEGDADEDSSSDDDDQPLNTLAPTSKFNPETDSSDEYSISSDDSYEDSDEFETEKSPQDHTPRDYTDILGFISKLAAEIEDIRIPHASHELTLLKSKLRLVKQDRSTSLRENTERSEIDSLASKSHTLHQYVVQKLIREGIDQCNIAIMRLGREKKDNREYYRRYYATIDLNDAHVWQLNQQITDLDRNVTALWKEIDEISSSERYDDFVDGDIDSDDSSIHYSPIPTKRNSSDRQWDRHQHASKKRKKSSKRRQQMPKRPRERRENAAPRKKTSTARSTDNQSSVTAGTRKRSTNRRQTQNRANQKQRDSSADFHSMSVESVGETDENAVQPTSSRAHVWSAAARKETSHTYFSSNKTRPHSQPVRTATQRTSTNTQTYYSHETRRDKNANGRLVERHPDTSTDVNTGTNFQTRPLSSKQQHGSNPARTRANEPVIPLLLSAENLFKSLSSTHKVSAREYSTGGNGVSSSSNRNVNDICRSLTEHYPNDLVTCNASLTDLSFLVETELQVDQTVIAFNCIHNIFQKRCSTFLDLIRSDFKDACFQIRCWCLIFKMINRKHHKKLQFKDGVVFNIFREPIALARHIIIQMIDCFYSQLLWREWGATNQFNAEVFESFSELRNHIGLVTPLLKILSDCLLTKFSAQNWYRSKMTEEKENDRYKLYFVTALNPDDHVLFMTTGQFQSASDEASRLKKFGQKISRREIHALWCMIGWYSSSPTLPTDLDGAKTRALLTLMIENNCGTLSKVVAPLPRPPDPRHIETCCQEIGWISLLISSKIIGTATDLDSLVTNALNRAVQLSSSDKRLCTLFDTNNNFSANAIVSNYWHSDIIKQSAKTDDRGQWPSFELPSFLVDDKTAKSWCLAPSTRLLQVCCSMLQAYAALAMSKKPKWIRLHRSLDAVISTFKKDALESEAKSNDNVNSHQGTDIGSAFANVFLKMDEFTHEKRIDSPVSAHIRESSCYVMFSCLIARRYSPSAFVEIGLNKGTREKLLQLSSDDATFHCHMHRIKSKPGPVPPCSRNLYSLSTSAKIMTVTALLHLFIDEREEPPEMLRNFETHLSHLGLDNDENALKDLVAAVVTILLGCCNVQDGMCKGTVDSTRSVVGIIQCISMWLSLIYHRAQCILVASANVNTHTNVCTIIQAIMVLGNEEFSSLVLKSLIRAVRSILSSLPTNVSTDFYSALDIAVKSCLASMKSVLGLIHVCHKKNNLSHPNFLLTAHNEFSNFLTSKVIPSMLKEDTRSHDRVLSRQASGAFMAVFAAFCTLPIGQKLIPSSIYGIFNIRNVTEAENQIYLQNMRTCFSSELICLSKKFPSCRYLLRPNLELLLNDILASLLDVETLMMFETSNTKQILSTGGNDLRKHIKPLLSVSENIHEMSDQSPDEEATLMRKENRREYLDTVGHHYMSQTLWFHCNQVAVLMREDVAIGNGEIRRGQSRSDFSGIGQKLHELCSELSSNTELLDMLPFISFERECLKRFIVLRGLILESIRVHHDSIIGTIVGSLFNNIHYLSEIALYNEKDFLRGCVDTQSRLRRGKAVAYQKAYLSLSGSLSTLLLRETVGSSNNSMNPSNRDMICTILRGLICHSFAGDKNIRAIIEDAHKEPILQFHLRKKITVPTPTDIVYLQSMTRDLAAVFLSRADDLLINDVHRKQKGLLTAMLSTSSKHGLLAQSHITIIANTLLFTPLSILGRSPRSISELQSAIDHHIHFATACRTVLPSIYPAIVSHRESILAPYLANKISFESNTVQRFSLQLLTEVLKTFSCSKPDEKIYNSERNLASFKTYVRIAQSLRAGLTSNLVDNDLTNGLKTCATALLSLPISTGTGNEFTTLQHHANTCSDDKLELTYIKEFSRWLDQPDSSDILDSISNLEVMVRELFGEAQKTKVQKMNPYISKSTKRD